MNYNKHLDSIDLSCKLISLKFKFLQVVSIGPFGFNKFWSLVRLYNDNITEIIVKGNMIPGYQLFILKMKLKENLERKKIRVYISPIRKTPKDINFKFK